MKNLIAVSIAICLLGHSFGCSAANDTLTCQEAKEYLSKNANNPEVKIIDVRTPEEFAQGHLISAININWKGSDFDSQVARLDKNQTYIIYCKRGGRSAKALAKMHSMGMLKSKHIKGGFDEWKNLGYKYE